ncbi:hypothetical protein DRJ48_05070 [Candidatus Woesearchaeota archaeon]|nr:hypothetical protein [Candidatus Woesearchaeota archaeon]RLE41695.1 MAG: hypothetical protein DRJ48_05070 [Candidatus Woesearchaeota archaeon]
MPEKIKLPTLTVQYRDVFLFKTLYFMIYEWLMDNGYHDEDGGEKRLEKHYEEHRHGDLRHYRIWWRPFRIPANSGFVKYHLDIDYLGLAIQQVEIMREGRRIKAQSGEINVFINGWIEVDFQEYFKKNFIMRYFEDTFKTRWMKKNLEGHKAELKRDAFRLHGVVKKFFDLWHSMPIEVLFHGKYEEV